MLTLGIAVGVVRKLVTLGDGYGFVVAEAALPSATRKGKQGLSVKRPDEARLCLPVAGDSVAMVGENRKMLIFPLAEVPQMERGRGVRLQRFKDGGVLDAKTFDMEAGLTWRDAADRLHTRSAADLAEWRAAHGQAGRMVPKGFPRAGQFN